MTNSLIFASAIDYVRIINDNIVDNALGKRDSFILLPSLYQRAFAICYETTELPLTTNVLAPNEALRRTRASTVNTRTAARPR